MLGPLIPLNSLLMWHLGLPISLGLPSHHLGLNIHKCIIFHYFLYIPQYHKIHGDYNANNKHNTYYQLLLVFISYNILDISRYQQLLTIIGRLSLAVYCCKCYSLTAWLLFLLSIFMKMQSNGEAVIEYLAFHCLQQAMVPGQILWVQQKMNIFILNFIIICTYSTFGAVGFFQFFTCCPTLAVYSRYLVINKICFVESIHIYPLGFFNDC